MRSDSEDQMFVNRCLSGDWAAFAFLVDKYKEVVHAYAYYRVNDYQAAQDITQEVLIKAYRKLGQLKWPHRFRSWLYTIASNECKMWFRSHSKEREQEVPLEDVPANELEELAVRNHSDKDIELTVKSAMETLPDANRLALSLYYMSSLSVSEIAEFMGASPNSVRIKLHRARKQLGERVEKMIGKQLTKEKLRSGFVMTMMNTIRNMPVPSLPKPRATKWTPIPISIGVVMLIGIIGFGVSSGRDISQDIPVIKSVGATWEVSLLTDVDEQAVDIEASGSELVALSGEDNKALESGSGSNTAVTIRRACEASDETDAWGAPSPDGRYVSFAGWEAANLMIRDLTTGEDRYLTDEGTWDGLDQWAEHSVWSPDGRQLAYIWWNNGYYQLRIVGLDGSKPRVLLSNEDKELGYVRPYEWSRDGKSILVYLAYWDFVDKPDGPHEIALVSVADGSERVLKSFEEPFARINTSLSPDGRYVVYAKAKCDIFLLATDGSGEVPLVEHPAVDLVPIWTPDGKAIVFISNRSGTPDAWLLQVTDGKPVGEPILIKRSIGWIRPMGFTQGGSLYYGFAVGGQNIYVTTLDPSTGELLSPPTKAIQTFEGFNSSPAWSPDGKYLAYASARRIFPGNNYGSVSVIVIRSVETGEELELRAAWCSKRHLYWSHDGRYIVCMNKMVDVQTGDVTTITQQRVQKSDLSPDGKTFFYITKKRIAAKNLETGKEQELLQQETQSDLEYWYNLGISPDGRHLAFSNYRSLKVMPTAGGEPREILHLDDPENFYYGARLTWTPDGRYILFVKFRDSVDNPHELWRIAAEGGEPQKLLTMEGLPMRDLRFISLHPDGQRIAFTGETPGVGEEIWVMENFLPGFTDTR